MSEFNKEMTLLPPPELVQYVGGDFKKVGKRVPKAFYSNWRFKIK